ncbi:MAG: hypothetical protein MSG64_06425 [Pyrinomonadaceae bacterium MAG19_C2-C3]|nr:hypothetical protein [Pyrinomonadaceae bacterium MAG19_C2-C3]
MGKRKINRSAVSGEFVTAAEAKAHPETTVTETVETREEAPLTPPVAALLALYRDDENAARSVVSGMDVESVRELCKTAIRLCVICEEFLGENADGLMDLTRESLGCR